MNELIMQMNIHAAAGKVPNLGNTEDDGIYAVERVLYGDYCFIVKNINNGICT